MRIGVVVAATFLAGWAAAAQAQTPAGKSEPTRIPASVEIYAKAIRTDSTAEVEELYRLGLRAADDLMSEARVESIGPYRQTLVVLEALDEADYKKTQDAMEGFIVFSELATVAIVDPRFFENLSRQRGDDVSIDFFETLRQTCDSVSVTWPAYIEQTTDFSGCPKFGSLELVRCFRLLTGFQRRHPERYTDRIAELLEELERELTQGNQSCGKKAGVEREFTAFLKEFPNVSIAPRVRERLEALRNGTIEMQFGPFEY